MNGASRVEQAYRGIQQQILDGRLEPGAVISEAVLARKLKMSRTPVGEAIRQLAQEGLLVQVPRFGTMVRRIDRRDLVELYEMRQALESFAAARAAERIEPDALARLQVLSDEMERVGEDARAAGLDALDAARLHRFLAADYAFHMQILESAGNRQIMQAVQGGRTISRIFRMRRQRHDRAIVDGAHRHHERILQALRKHDAEAARVRMAGHIAESLKETLADFDRPDAVAPAAAVDDLPREVAAALDKLEREAAAELKP
jgi:DNA-binding GntR family transcriptional regulator